MRIVNKLFVALIMVILLSSCDTLQQLTQKPAPIIQKLPPQYIARETSPVAAPSASTILKKKIKIAALLPLSGKHKELGQSLLNSAIISIFENDKNSDLELVIYDVGEGPNDAVKAIKEVAKNNIKIVLGPVFSDSLRPIADIVKKNDITVLSFSNNMELTSKKGIFLMGFFPEQQVEKAVSYAISTGRDSFAIIAPNNPYGLKVSDIYKETVKRKDGSFVTNELYLNNGKDVDKIAARIVNAFMIPDRLRENNAGSKKTKIIISDRDKIYSKVIFIPESGRILSKIVAAIKKYNVSERDFQIVGTNSWDDASTLNDPNLIGSWFVSADPTSYKDFERKYYNIYGKFPVRIDSISYDAIAAVSALVNQSGKRDLKPEDFIKYDGPKNGFQGIDGLFRFLPNGIVQRNLAVLQVGNAKFEIADSPSNIFLRY